MILINLLPWREQLREEQKREFFLSLAASAAVAIFIALIIHIIIIGFIHSQNYRNTVLQDEINLFDQQIKEIQGLQKEKELLIARMNIIQELQTNRSEVVKLFDNFVRILPDGVYLESIKRENQLITLTGKAESNTRISALMRNIENSSSMKSPMLTEIKNDEKLGNYSYSFILQAQQISAKPADSTKSDKPGASTKENK